ncbi:MAG: cold-shock protein [Prolixibacteraceae bacterium]
MGRSQESFNKKEVRNKKEKKRKEKVQKRLARKDSDKSSFDDMIAYVDENGVISDTPPDPLTKKKTKLEDIEISVPKSTETEEDKIRIGIVSYFNESKGFGFIRDSMTKESLFVHINNVEGEIGQDNKVSYETERGPKGMVAINVKLYK